MCECCKVGKGNLFELNSEKISFGDTELSLDLLFGIDSKGNGNIRAVLYNGCNAVRETMIYTEYCPICGRELEK